MTIRINAVDDPPGGRVKVWEELQKQLKKAITNRQKDTAAKMVTLLVTVIGGQQDERSDELVTSENWTKFGQIQEAVYGDPKMQALMAETLKIATWEIYTAQTLELGSQSQKCCPNRCRRCFWPRVIPLSDCSGSLEVRLNPRPGWGPAPHRFGL